MNIDKEILINLLFQKIDKKFISFENDLKYYRTDKNFMEIIYLKRNIKKMFRQNIKILLRKSN